MSKMIQVRNVPDDLHRRLKAQAAEKGLTLSDYLLSELREVAGKPTLAELAERIALQEPNDIKGSAAAIIREHRGALP